MSFRLLFVIDNLGSGGAQRQMVTLADGLKARGHEVEFFLYAPGEMFFTHLREANIPVLRQLKRSRYSVDVIFALRHYVNDRRYDLVLAYLPTPSFYAIAACRMSRKRPSIVVSERNTDLPEGRPWQENMVRLFYRLADFVVTNSKCQRSILLEKHPGLENKIMTIYNGLDLQRFYPSRCELPPTPLRLLAIGTLKREKNALCLVRALNILSQEYRLHPHVSWVGRHFGESVPAEFSYGQQLKQEIRDFGLSDQWHWLYERNDIVNLLHRHHALVHPSYREGFPNVVCEAMACGRPVILSNTLEHPHLVEHGRSGLLFDWREPRELARTIREFWDMTIEQRELMGQQGRTFAEQHLSTDRLVEDYERLFCVLVG